MKGARVHRDDPAPTRSPTPRWTDIALLKTIGMNLEEAKAARAEIVTRKAKGERVVSTKMTLAEYAENNDFPALQLRSRTAATYRGSFERYVRPTLGPKKDRGDHGRRRGEAVADLGRRGYAPWTVRGMLTALGRIFRDRRAGQPDPVEPGAQA